MVDFEDGFMSERAVFTELKGRDERSDSVRLR